MSYFDSVYADHELSTRAMTVCMYLHDRANREGENWYAISTIASDLVIYLVLFSVARNHRI